MSEPFYAVKRDGRKTAIRVLPDKAEAEAYRRAVQGYEQDVWYQGVKVGEQRMYSDQLLALILKGNRKRVYSDRTEHTGADGGPLEIKTIERVILKPNE